MAWKTKNTNMFFEFSHLNAETMKFVEILRHGNGESNSGAKGNNVSSKEMEHQEGAPSGRISLQEMRSLRAPCNRPDCKDIQNKINEIFAERKEIAYQYEMLEKMLADYNDVVKELSVKQNESFAMLHQTEREVDTFTRQEKNLKEKLKSQSEIKRALELQIRNAQYELGQFNSEKDNNKNSIKELSANIVARLSQDFIPPTNPSHNARHTGKYTFFGGKLQWSCCLQTDSKAIGCATGYVNDDRSSLLRQPSCIPSKSTIKNSSSTPILPTSSCFSSSMMPSNSRLLHTPSTSTLKHESQEYRKARPSSSSGLRSSTSKTCDLTSSLNNSVISKVDQPNIQSISSSELLLLSNKTMMYYNNQPNIKIGEVRCTDRHPLAKNKRPSSASPASSYVQSSLHSSTQDNGNRNIYHGKTTTSSSSSSSGIADSNSSHVMDHSTSDVQDSPVLMNRDISQLSKRGIRRQQGRPLTAFRGPHLQTLGSLSSVTSVNALFPVAGQ